MSNVWKRGTGESSYHECAAAPLNLSETIANTALTGTVATTASSRTITGTGTAFTTELHLGQAFLIVDVAGSQSFFCVVERIDSATSLVISRAPSSSVSGKTGYRLPIIFPVDTQRGTALRGNVVKLDKGTLFSVGDGTFRLDGAAISNTLVLTRAPKISILSGSTYNHYSLGMDTPGTPSAASVAGGTKGMIAASYAIRVTPERLATLGFNNPSVRAAVTLLATERIQITFPAVDTTHGQDAWGVWGTRYVDSQDTSGQNTINGPWFRVGQVAETALDGSRRANFEWLDGEVETQGAGLAGSLLTFDNDAPPNAEFVALFNGVPVWISTNGPGDTSPGPFIRPAKPSNVEAAPAGLGYPTSPPELIIGAVPSEARLYLLTTNHLEIAQPTASDLVPVRISPYWKAGFKNPYQFINIDGELYASTNAGPFRSQEGNEDQVQIDWASPIAEFYKSWVKGHVMLEHDPSNDSVVYFHSAHSLNSAGFWTTRWWAFGRSAQEWIGEGVFSSSTQDMIVSGVAKVGSNLEILMGGRKSDNTVEVKTYRFDQGTDAVDYYIAPNFTDSGEESRPKRIGPGLRVTGKVTSGSLKVYGAGPSEAVPVSDLEAGTNALATLTLANDTSIKEGAALKANVKNLKQHTVRVSGTWNGSGDRDSIHEIVYEYNVEGARR